MGKDRMVHAKINGHTLNSVHSLYVHVYTRKIRSKKLLMGSINFPPPRCQDTRGHNEIIDARPTVYPAIQFRGKGPRKLY